MNMNKLSPIESLSHLRIHMMMLAVEDTNRFLGYCKRYHMLLDVKQKIQTDTKHSVEDKSMHLGFCALRLKFLYCIFFHIDVPTVNETKLFLGHFKHYHMVVSLKQKIKSVKKFQSETET